MLSDDKTKVCRKIPVQQKDNFDECTIYVENIKSDTTHEWLKSVFSEFGNVTYVSIPKYKNNNLNKGFAFIEFETEDIAKKTVQFFEEIGCKMSSQMTPDQLASILTYEPKDETSSTSNNKKQSTDCQGNSENEEDTNKEVKIENPNGNGVSSEASTELEVNKNSEPQTRKRKADTNVEVSETKRPNLSTDADTHREIKTNNDADEKKKKKRQQKRKLYFKELGLQILSK